MKPIKEGKVREIYELPEALILVATDRISCFDVILHNMIEGKGKVLTQISKFWLSFGNSTPILNLYLSGLLKMRFCLMSPSCSTTLEWL